jgi:hypothetical protein
VVPLEDLLPRMNISPYCVRREAITTWRRALRNVMQAG